MAGSLPLIRIAAAAPAPAAKTITAAEATHLALAITDQFIIPAYRVLVDATAAQEKAWTAFIAKREAGDIAPLRATYNTACDAWARAQIVKTGPVSLFLRYDRFAYWPEARNVTQRTLDALLASNDPKDMSAETLAHDAVAAQGLTALERLLYEDNGEAALKASGKAGVWRASVGQGLARNLAAIARDVLKDWTAPNGVRAAIAANKGWNNLFADAPEAARLLLTDLVAAFRVMHDVKLLPVLGISIDLAKPKMAEAWRSHRAQRDLKLNLDASLAMEKGFSAGMNAAHQAKIVALFAAAAKAVDAAPADLGEAAADPARRPKVDAARAAIKAVQTEIAASVPADTGITLGFNNLDGD